MSVDKLPTLDRLFELIMVPAEELKKEPQKINEKMKLLLKKKTIIRNHRKVGLLPKVTQPMLRRERGPLGEVGGTQDAI